MEAVSAIPGLVDTCVKLFDRLHASYKKLKGLPQSVESIQRDLRAIQEAIRKRSATADQDGIRSWISDLREIWQRIEDAVDFYNFKVTGEQDGTRKLAGIIPSAHDALRGPRKKLLQDIEAIKQLLTEANGRVHSYHQLVPGDAAVENQEEAYSHPKEAFPEGLETPTAELVQTLKQGIGRARPLRVVAISGPGGSGKSILAEAAYNKVQEEETFDYKAWVTASHSVKNMLGDILDQMGFARPLPSKSLSQHLRNQLHKKRYIVGIDGLETIGYWNDILYACPEDNMGSRIIVTTTVEEVARSCHKNCPVPVYKMQPLDMSYARALLVRKAFGEDGCPDNLDKGLIMILEICEYLPLAIANMGDHMRSTRGWNGDMCVEACNKIGSLLAGKKKGAFLGMCHVLNRSYAGLSDNAKICLLSLNAFPNDDGIKRKSLVRRWLAERLIACPYNKLEDLANECFSELVEYNFILPTKVSISGQVKTFRIHRMMLQFIKDKAISENFVTWLHIHRGMKMAPQANIRRLYIHNNSAESLMVGEEIDLSRVRLLTFHGKASRALMDLNGSTFLRVLVLENIENLIYDNLNTLRYPSMLKYLSIRGNKQVSKLPEDIVNLRLLETLDTRDTQIDIIPMEVILLPELVHLFGEFQITCTKRSLKKFSSTVCKLQTLSGFFIDESLDFVKLLPCIPKLAKLKILSRRSTLSDEVITDLLVSLKGCFEKELCPTNLHLHSLCIDFRAGCDLNFLDDLDVPSPCFLRSLKLRGKLTILPKFILSDSLTELCLSGSNIGVNILLGLQSLQRLQFLKVTEDPFRFKQGELYRWSKGWFVNLKRLCFVVPKLPKIVIEEKAMEGLESLQLFCTELGGFSGIEHLSRLEELILHSHVRGPEADDMLQQARRNPMRPRFRKAPADADGPSQSGRMLERTTAFRKSEEN